jgi:hypothetical protein
MNDATAVSLPWVRVLLLIRSITSATWGHEAWPEVKPVLRRALEMRRQIAREGWWNSQRTAEHVAPRRPACQAEGRALRRACRRRGVKWRPEAARRGPPAPARTHVTTSGLWLTVASGRGLHRLQEREDLPQHVVT